MFLILLFLLCEKQKIIMKISIKKSIFILFALLILLGGCTKKYEERLEGKWEWVDVVDINSTMVEEWHFIDFNFTIIRYERSNPEDSWIYEQGTFFLDWGVFGTYLNIEGTSIDSYNTEWDVIKLSNDELIISNDIDGGIMYKEFIKLIN